MSATALLQAPTLAEILKFSLFINVKWLGEAAYDIWVVWWIVIYDGTSSFRNIDIEDNTCYKALNPCLTVYVDIFKLICFVIGVVSNINDVRIGNCYIVVIPVNYI